MNTTIHFIIIIYFLLLLLLQALCKKMIFDTIGLILIRLLWGGVGRPIPARGPTRF